MTDETHRRADRTRLCIAPMWLLAGMLLSGCAATTGSSGSSGTNTSANAGAAKVPPGMNERGDVTDPQKVEAGHGQKVKGIGGWDGEITGKPVPGSKFAQLKIGMTASEAQALLGAPTDFGAHTTAKAFIPFYFGADKARYEAVYKGQGRLLFASNAGTQNDKMHLIWIIHSAQERGVR